jgi:L-fuculose-phosphate aldolase
MSDWTLRRGIIRTARRTVEAALTHGTSGNVSARSAGGFYVTPTGVMYDVLQPSDIVEMDMDGNALRSNRRPSSEWRIHRDVYAARPEINAVVHVHPPFATTIACLRRDLPAVHYMVAAAGGATIRCAGYATFGTEELSRLVLEALDGRLACLMANHGLVALGADLDVALKVAVETEKVAEVYWRALSAGTPVVLDEEEMRRVAVRFKDYGQQR